MFSRVANDFFSTGGSKNGFFLLYEPPVEKKTLLI